MSDLSGFDSAEKLHQLIGEMQGQGWLLEDGDELRLTASGVELHAAVAAEVEQIRGAVALALPADEYERLVRLLGRLVDAFPPVPDAG